MLFIPFSTIALQVDDSQVSWDDSFQKSVAFDLETYTHQSINSVRSNRGHFISPKISRTKLCLNQSLMQWRLFPKQAFFSPPSLSRFQITFHKLTTTLAQLFQRNTWINELGLYPAMNFRSWSIIYVQKFPDLCSKALLISPGEAFLLIQHDLETYGSFINKKDNFDKFQISRACCIREGRSILLTKTVLRYKLHFKWRTFITWALTTLPKQFTRNDKNYIVISLKMFKNKYSFLKFIRTFRVLIEMSAWTLLASAADLKDETKASKILENYLKYGKELLTSLFLWLQRQIFCTETTVINVKLWHRSIAKYTKMKVNNNLSVFSCDENRDSSIQISDKIV